MKTIDSRLLDELSRKAEAHPRKRANHNLHGTSEDPVQRLFNAVEPGTYIRPHRHGVPATWELFIVVRGALALLIFNDDGTVRARLELSAGGPVSGVDVPENTWHAMVSHEKGTVFLEIKKGPYRPVSADHAAPWAPDEGTEGAVRCEKWYRTAGPGSRFG